jgi:glycosyltransferase involved in cell wall biosynthesis
MWGGGALRTASILNYLAGRYSLDLVLFREGRSWDPSAALPKDLAERILVVDLPVHSRGFPARLIRNAGRLLRGAPPLIDRFAGYETRIEPFLRGHEYDLAVIEHFWCAPYEPLLRRCARRVTLNLHNIESRLHERYGAAEGGVQALAHSRFASAYARLERRWIPRFDGVLVPSEGDALWPNAAVYPNALPFMEAPARQERERIIFTGNLAYHPNVQAVRWFASEVWPGLAARHPSLEWRLAGKNEEAVRGLVAHLPRVHLTGMIEDSMAELAAARVAVVPLLSGSGTRLKILEAWASGTPVVSTPIGAEGLGGEGELPLVLASDAAGFARAIEALLADESGRRGLAGRGRRYWEQRFTWQAAWKALENYGI